MKDKIFLSHSSKNAEIASELCTFLESNGKKCFIAPRDIRFGMEYAEEIVNGIEESEAMILILSKESNESPHVLREIERAVTNGIPIIVYRIEDVKLSKSLEYFLMTNQWMDAIRMSDYNNILTCINQVLDNEESKALAQTSGSGKIKFGNASKKISIAAGIIAIVIVILLVVIIMKMPSENKDNEIQSSEITKEIKVGDVVSFGNYLDEEIKWNVLKISEDKETAILITDDIICMKPYDVAEGGEYNIDKDGNSYYEEESEADTNQELQINVRGNSDWSKSNIRTWLNSTSEAVEYSDQKPTDYSTSDKKNGYYNEPGFLYGFSEDELKAIVITENVTKGNEISGEEEIKTEDKVFLLSIEQLEWLKEAGVSELAKPTQAAIDDDETNWYTSTATSYGLEEYLWWLREPVQGYSSKCFIVGNGYYEENNVFERNVGLEGFGIRPAMTVDMEMLKNCISNENNGKE